MIVAVDTEGGRILVRGWQEKLRLRPEEVFPELAKYASEFLCTYVDAEGTMRGTNLDWFRRCAARRRCPSPPPVASAAAARFAPSSRSGHECRRGHGPVSEPAALSAAIMRS